MREARESHGVGLRQMAKRLNYSHSTLSNYERGGAMPTEQVVHGYEHLLGLEPASLMKVLEAARIERHGDAWAKRRAHVPVEFAGEKAKPVASALEGHGRRLAWLRGRRALVAGIVAAGLLLLVGVPVVLALQGRETGTPSPTSVDLGLDNRDPKVAGCDDGATTADKVDMFDPPQHLVGVLELRSSARCGASWGRFSPSELLVPTPKVEVEINVHRPADGGVAPFRLTYPGRGAAIYGDMLVSRHECVYAEVILHRVGKSSPSAQTACRQSAVQD
jgi:transcriptional regulator with XRE-family HTH domain